jgi:altronate hydrolase
LAGPKSRIKMPEACDVSRLEPDPLIQLHPADNVGVAACHLEAKTQARAGGADVVVSQPVRLGHKIAIRPIAEGQPIVKFGQPIGVAAGAIAAGDWVHCHNVADCDPARDYASATQVPPAPEPIRGRTFAGYRRPDGKAGTRNYVAVISTVNCSASVSKYVTRRFTADVLAKYPHVDGVVPLTHTTGCGMQFGGLKHELLNRVMGGMSRHPNVGGYVIVGLGCEQANANYLIEQQGLVQIQGLPERQPDRGHRGSAPLVLTMQELGGTVKTVERAAELVAQLLPRVNDARREPIPASQLIVATQCGGSDGSSGITANPAVGVASDMVVACGGTTVLGETTEIYGAENLLTRRARTVEVAQKLIERVRWWDWYTGIYNVRCDNNPSVGNKLGGLTTIAEKSLGAIAKAGSTALNAVYEYAEPIAAKGLVFMDTPGYDPVSITGMVAGGANLVVFTTGRGSCYGCRPVPSIKIASNTPMYRKMIDDMDVDAGSILSGRTVRQVGYEIFEEMLAVAGGKRTKSERHGIGEEEFIPWTVGPTL